jgi:hypothetical protein
LKTPYFKKQNTADKESPLDVETSRQLLLDAQENPGVLLPYVTEVSGKEESVEKP